MEPAMEDVQCLLPVHGAEHFQPVHPQEHLEGIAKVAVIFDD